jgi:hypothetical protein
MNRINKRIKRAGAWLAWTTLFALSYSPSPLFTSNQNQYFLKGLAHAGWGDLTKDWLVQTRDSTPVFSLLVEWAYRLTGTETIFYFIYTVLMGVYLYSLLGILDHIFEIKRDRGKRWLTLGLIVLLHSTFVRGALSRTLGFDWSYLLEGGWAGQRLLGGVLQPSSFGVLLLLSICLFLNKRVVWAVLLLPLTATLHPTYLLSAGALTGAYLLLTLYQERDWGQVFALGMLALALVGPVVQYSTQVFWSQEPALFADTRAILVDFRIPHHAVIRTWWNGSSWVQLALLLTGMGLLRETRLFKVLLLPTLVILSGTATQYLIDNDNLALLFPWRLSTWGFPLCTAVVIGSIARWGLSRWNLRDRLDTRWAYIAVSIVLAGLAAFGVWNFVQEREARANVPERDLLTYVTGHKTPQDIYIVPIDWQNFRLETGAPVVTEFKSIPYYEADVDQWHQRVSLVSKFYREWGRTRTCRLLERPLVNAWGATHLVLPRSDVEVVCPGMVVAFVGEYFVLYSLDGNR